MENKKEHTNLSYLSDLANGSNEFMQQMISVFMEQTPKAIAGMKQNLEEKNWKQLAATAHKIKPSFAFMGIKELESVVIELEECCAKQIELEKVPASINHIEKVCEEAMAELSEKSKALA